MFLYGRPRFFGRTPTPPRKTHISFSHRSLTLPPQAGPPSPLAPPYAWICTSKQVLHWGALS